MHNTIVIILFADNPGNCQKYIFQSLARQEVVIVNMDKLLNRLLTVHVHYLLLQVQCVRIRTVSSVRAKITTYEYLSDVRYVVGLINMTSGDMRQHGLTDTMIKCKHRGNIKTLYLALWV